MPLARKKLMLITTMYWVLLLYILAALVWWFIALEHQNQEMTNLRLQEKKPGDPGYIQWVDDTLNMQKRKHVQYVGEGSIFMLLIVVGAVFVYRSTRKQWKLSQQQQNFMMAVTHELKTPIAIARLNLETLIRRKLEPSMQEKILHDTLTETDRLNDLCNNILLASRLEAGSYHYHKELILLHDLAARSVKRFSERFPQRTIDLKAPDAVEIFGEPLLISMLINNLVENAIKYTAPDAMIEVSIEKISNGCMLLVADNGPGIPEAEKQLVFNKFYRMGDENTRLAKGTGLGLYLCKKIVAQHNASIHIKDNKPQGSIFTVHFRS